MANQTGTQGTQSTGAGRTHGGGTGVADPVYNLISIVYHALQGAQTYHQYEQDAQGDQQLAQFFRQVCDEEKRRAQQGRELLAQALQRGGSGGQQLQGGGGQQRGGSSGGQQGQSGSGQQSQSGSRSSQMGGSSTSSGQHSQSSGSSSQMGGPSQHGSSSSDRGR